MIREVTDEQAISYLGEINMSLGEWHQIVTDLPKGGHCSKSYPSPSSPLELFSFSQHIIGWVPQGKWKMLITDYSNALPQEASIIVGRLLSETRLSCSTSFNIFFEYSEDKVKNYENDIILSAIAHVLLLFEGHGYVVSSDSHDYQLIGIQDGLTSLFSTLEGLYKADQLMDIFESSPLASPDWLLNYNN